MQWMSMQKKRGSSALGGQAAQEVEVVVVVRKRDGRQRRERTPRGQVHIARLEGLRMRNC